MDGTMAGTIHSTTGAIHIVTTMATIMVGIMVGIVRTGGIGSIHTPIITTITTMATIITHIVHPIIGRRTTIHRIRAREAWATRDTITAIVQGRL